jgi:hypothetical protein
VEISESDFIDEVGSLAKVLRGLARETHEYVSRKRDCRTHFPRALHNSAVFIEGVTPIHALQDVRAAALQRQMQMPADARVGEQLQESVIEVHWVDGTDAYPGNVGLSKESPDERRQRAT